MPSRPCSRRRRAEAVTTQRPPREAPTSRRQIVESVQELILHGVPAEDGRATPSFACRR